MPIAEHLRTDPVAARARREELLDEWTDLGAQIAALEARRVDVLAERFELQQNEAGEGVTHSSMVQRSIFAEYAAAGHVSPGTMEQQFCTAVALSNRYRGTLQALRDGRISRRHAEVIVSSAPTGPDGVDDGETLVAAYEHDVLPFACTTTAARTRVHALAVAAALRPVTMEEAHREAFAEREVSTRPTADGLGQLILTTSEVFINAIMNRASAAAREMDDERTMDQRRADFITDLLLAADPSTMIGTALEAIRPVVQVTIAASTLAGLDDNMAQADGLGPVHPDLARDLAGRASSFTRLFLDPAGMVTNVDTYVPSSRMKKYLRARDQHCRFPGCRRSTSRSQIDHNTDHALGGKTAIGNLACFCTSHHPLKHPDVDREHRWRVKQEPEGTLVWTSPLGREYVDHPEPRVMFV